MESVSSYAIFDTSLDATVVVDERFNLLYANEAMSILCEVPLRQILKKKTVGDLLQFTPPRLNAIFKEVGEGASPYEELDYASSSGKAGKLQVSVQSITGPAGKPELLLYFRDVTLEEKLQAKYRAELMQKDEKISEISLLLEISQVLTGFSDRRTTVTNVARKLISHGLCEAVAHFSVGADATNFEIHFFGPQEQGGEIEGSRQAPSFNVFNRLWENTAPETLKRPDANDVFTLLNSQVNFPKVTQLIAFPVRTPKHHGGGLILFREKPLPESILPALISICSQMAVALESAQFFENSITDGMTKLFNNRYFQTRLETELARTKRTTEKLSLILFDVDHFKKFNDTYGHLTGDEVLKVVAATVKGVCRNFDIAARYGGEEFVVILPNTNPEQAMIVSERLRKKIESVELKHKDLILHITVSLGISVFPDHTTTAQELIALSDKALYTAKGAGRNCSRLYVKVDE